MYGGGGGATAQPQLIGQAMPQIAEVALGGFLAPGNKEEWVPAKEAGDEAPE